MATPTTATATANTPIHCTICTTPLPASAPSALFPCSHAHCLPCLRLAYTLTLYPPFRPVQCCPPPQAPLPVPVLRRLLALTSAEVAAYRARLAEHDAQVKLYCFDPHCGEFIPRALRSGGLGRCRGCKKRTCKRCGGQEHGGRWCRVEEEEEEEEGEVARAKRGDTRVGGKKGKEREREEELGRIAREKVEARVREEGFRRVVREMGW
ncbi:hypothetical protein NEMBOFW57_002205 [Staphylotrichum longicolle]|uniref:RING-type domain-containing protein n=1 Tax=Staphylotrichum longicolle TaxID=669026 RepID=A0AAD4I3E2_9PEZI|nr:hypothetical protein NEMBOFW57_002205 [Staphylotrichum longicolle]